MAQKLRLKNIRKLILFLTLFYCCLFSKKLFGANNNSFLKVKSTPPPGFERRLYERIYVDVYYNKNFITSTEIERNGSTFRLLNPNQIYENLPPIKPEKIKKVKEKLDTISNFNSRYACYPERKSDCDMLATGNIAMAFNPNLSTVEIITNNDIFIKQKEESYLKPQENSFSQFFKFNATGYWGKNKSNDDSFGYIASPMYYESNDDELYNVNVNSKTLFMGYTLNTDLNYINERDNPFLNNIYLIKYNKKTNLQIGEFNTTDLRSLNQGNLLGFSLKSSVNRRKNDNTAFSSPLSIYLNYRSTVNIIKDGMIYSTQYYDAGTQDLDTTNLPQGSYNVEIEIIEPNGNRKRENQFFVKNGELPPDNELNFWLEFGAIQNYNGNYYADDGEDKIFNGYENDYLFRGGLYKNMFKNTGIGTNIMLNKDISGFEFFTEFFGRYALLKNSVSFDTYGNYGYNIYGQIGDNKRYLLYVSWTQNYLKDKIYIEDYTYKPIASYARTGSMNLKYYFWGGRDSIGIRGNYYKDQSDYETYSIGPEIEFNINRIKNTNIKLTFSAYKTEKDYQGLINLSFNFNSKYAQLYNSSTYRTQKDRKTDEKEFNENFDSSTALTLQDGGVFNQDLRFTARYDYTEKVSTESAELDYRSGLGRLLANASTNEYLNQYSINFSSIFAFNKESVLFGGRELKDSALAIEIDGGNRNELFDIYVNQNKVDFAKGNTVRTLTLDPFDEYNISIQPQGSSYGYIFEQSKNSFVHYPGSVNTIKYRAKSTIVLISTLYTKDGNILANTKIKGQVDETYTDENGDFQILAVLGELLTVDNNLKIQVPKKTNKNKVITIDKMLIYW